MLCDKNFIFLAKYKNYNGKGLWIQSLTMFLLFTEFQLDDYQNIEMP